MEVNPANRPLNLVEADVIEALETGPTDRSHPVIWNQEVFLPPHEYVLSLRHSGDVKVALPGLLLKWPESGEFGPVLQIYFISRAPVLMLSEKCVFRANDLSFEVCSEGWVVFGQPF
jgi:hypothetical protein